MLWSAYAFDDDLKSWMWWTWVEQQGRAQPRTSRKFQQERWHLKSLHDKTVLDALAEGLASELGAKHGQATVRVGSIWVDQTPQATTKYLEPGGVKPRIVKCELADLVVVTHVSFGGAPVAPGDTRALLVQAKVTDVPGVLDAAGKASSSAKERNLLERCCSPITLWTGTGLPGARKVSSGASGSAGTKLGEYNLTRKPNKLGLGAYARYLTIPRKLVPLPVAAYQGMWPTSRAHNVGSSMSLGELVRSMLQPGCASTIGEPLNGAFANAEWRRLIRDLTKNYHEKVVNRFTSATSAPIPRLSESQIYSCFMQTPGQGPGAQLVVGTPRGGTGRAAVDLFALQQPGGTGGGGAREEGNPIADFDDAPAIPVLVVRADIRTDRPRDPQG